MEFFTLALLFKYYFAKTTFLLFGLLSRVHEVPLILTQTSGVHVKLPNASPPPLQILLLEQKVLTFPSIHYSSLDSCETLDFKEIIVSKLALGNNHLKIRYLQLDVQLRSLHTGIFSIYNILSKTTIGHDIKLV